MEAPFALLQNGRHDLRTTTSTSLNGTHEFELPSIGLVRHVRTIDLVSPSELKVTDELAVASNEFLPFQVRWHFQGLWTRLGADVAARSVRWQRDGMTVTLTAEWADATVAI